MGARALAQGKGEEEWKMLLAWVLLLMVVVVSVGRLLVVSMRAGEERLGPMLTEAELEEEGPTPTPRSQAGSWAYAHTWTPTWKAVAGSMSADLRQTRPMAMGASTPGPGEEAACGTPSASPASFESPRGRHSEVDYEGRSR